MDLGEDIAQAAIRETKEEAGMDVALKGVLRMEMTSAPSHVRIRVIFFAEPLNLSQKPKSLPDFESVGATWMTKEEIDSLPLRGSEPQKWSSYLENGGLIFPMSILVSERTSVHLTEPPFTIIPRASRESSANHQA